MRKNREIQHTTVAELAYLYWKEGGRHFDQDIYKYTSKFTVRDHYWFQHRRELIAQAE